MEHYARGDYLELFPTPITLTYSQHEKQFYLDQAKHLKETFNTRYPDYVYRRRPNNSRKRRRTDGHIRSVDNPHPMDHADDYVGDLGEPSPTEGEESSHGEPPSLSSFSRPSHDVSQSYGEKYGSSRSRSSGHPYSPSDSFRSNGANEHRLPYVSPQNSERLSSSLGSTASLSSPRLTQPTQPTLQYPYGPPGQGQSSLYHTEHPEPRETWTPRVERGPSSWLGGNRERSLTSLGGQKPHSYSASAGPGSWPPSASSSMSTSSSSTPQTTHYAFPTLTSPFYPNQPQPTFQPASATSTSHSSSSAHYDTTHIPPTSMSRDFDNRGYGSSPSVSPAAAYPAGQSRDSLPYPQRSGSRGLPSVHAMSGYVPPPPSSSGSGSANPAGSQGYWAR